MDYVPFKQLYPNNLSDYSNYVLYNNQSSETDKCVVLDIDETCVHSFEDAMPSWLRDPEYKDILSNCYEIHPVDAVDDAGTGNILPMWGIRRPHLTEFLVFCHKYFRHVLVWSAGAKHYVHEVVRAIFTGLPSPTLIYTRDDIPSGPTTKPLPIIINDDTIRNSGCSLDNTYIIDDRYDYFMNNPNNGVQIPAYSPPMTPEALRADDQSLLVLKWWLSQPTVKKSYDIRTLDKSSIFIYSAQYWEQKSANENSADYSKSNYSNTVSFNENYSNGINLIDSNAAFTLKSNY